uniref:Uncharacterized protein n=1 Tax=Anopheles culicifacies TaxID=139723 RepID=A0A182M1B2_9DIPT
MEEYPGRIVSSSSKSSSKSSSSSSRSSATSSVVANVERVLSDALPHASPGTATACSLLMLSTIGSQFQAVSPEISSYLRLLPHSVALLLVLVVMVMGILVTAVAVVASVS